MDYVHASLSELLFACPLLGNEQNPYRCVAQLVTSYSNPSPDGSAKIQLDVIRVLLGVAMGMTVLGLVVRARRGNLWFLRTLMIRDGKRCTPRRLKAPNAIPCFLIVMSLWCAGAILAATRAYQTESGQLKLIQTELVFTIASLLLWIAGWLQMCALVFSVPRFIHSSASTTTAPTLWLNNTTPNPFSLNRLPTWLLYILQLLPPIAIVASALPFMIIAVIDENSYVSSNAKLARDLEEMAEMFDGGLRIPEVIQTNASHMWTEGVKVGTRGLQMTRIAFVIICSFDGVFFLLYYRFTWAIFRLIRQQLVILNGVINRLPDIGNNQLSQESPALALSSPTARTSRDAQSQLRSTRQSSSEISLRNLWNSRQAPERVMNQRQPLPENEVGSIGNNEKKSPAVGHQTTPLEKEIGHLSWIPEDTLMDSLPTLDNSSRPDSSEEETPCQVERTRLFTRRRNLRWTLYHVLFLAIGIFIAFSCDIIATLLIAYELTWPNFKHLMLTVFWAWATMSASAMTLLAWTGFLQPKYSENTNNSNGSSNERHSDDHPDDEDDEQNNLPNTPIIPYGFEGAQTHLPSRDPRLEAQDEETRRQHLMRTGTLPSSSSTFPPSNRRQTLSGIYFPNTKRSPLPSSTGFESLSISTSSRPSTGGIRDKEIGEIKANGSHDGAGEEGVDF